MRHPDELKKLIQELEARSADQHVTILVGMATCGLSAGAGKVYEALRAAVASVGRSDVAVKQTGCIGVCRLEPMFEILDETFGRTTYVDMTPDKAREVVQAHLVENRVIDQYTITAYD